MIKTENGSFECKGNTIEILAELSLIIHQLKFEVLKGKLPADKVESLLQEAVKTGLKTTEEVEKEVDERIKNIFGTVDFLSEVFGVMK